MPTATKSFRVPDSGRAHRLRVSAGACSMQGARRDRNEDSQYVSPGMDLFIVADGMGGHAAGEVASRFAVDVLSHELAQVGVEADDREVEYRVHAALDRANCLILDAASHDPKCRGAGTTVVLALLVNHRLYIAGVGDSRAYLIRGGSIERLTVDDTWPDTLFHLGQISADEAREHHMRNILLTALGIPEFSADKEQIHALDVYLGDRYLLASDGVTDIVEEKRMLEIIRDQSNPQQAAKILAQEAIENGGGDDVTSVLFYVQSDKSDEPPVKSNSILWERLTSLLKPRS